MKKENVIDFAAYRDETQTKAPADDDGSLKVPAAMSDELKAAIQVLIERLRADGK
jgi:hypothetical protein